MKYTVQVDESRCVACGTCRRECHHHLPVYKGAKPVSNRVDCIGCLHCYAVCPENAITVIGSEGPIACKTSTDPLVELTARRRSCRRYAEKQIDEETLRKVTRVAAYIPSGGNSQSHMLTILTESETRKRLERELERIYRRKRQLLGNPFLRRVGAIFSDAETREFLKDPFYFRQITYLLEQFDQGLDPIFYRAPVVVMVHSKRLIPTPREDCILAAYNMVLAAESAGLGSCFVSLAQKGINSSPSLKRLLSMDSAEQVHAVIVLGYPAVQYHRPIYRDSVPIRRFDRSESSFPIGKEASEWVVTR